MSGKRQAMIRCLDLLATEGYEAAASHYRENRASIPAGPMVLRSDHEGSWNRPVMAWAVHTIFGDYHGQYERTLIRYAQEQPSNLWGKEPFSWIYGPWVLAALMAVHSNMCERLDRDENDVDASELRDSLEYLLTTHTLALSLFQFGKTDMRFVLPAGARMPRRADINLPLAYTFFLAQVTGKCPKVPDSMHGKQWAWPYRVMSWADSYELPAGCRDMVALPDAKAIVEVLSVRRVRMLTTVDVLVTEDGYASWLGWNTHGTKPPIVAILAGTNPDTVRVFYGREGEGGGATRSGRQLVIEATGERVDLPGGKVSYHVSIGPHGVTLVDGGSNGAGSPTTGRGERRPTEETGRWERK